MTLTVTDVVSNITQLVCGMSTQLSAQGAFACFVVHIVCQVDVIAYSLVLYLQYFVRPKI